MGDGVITRFSPATRKWFEESFSAPTAAQSGAWDAISAGQHTLVVAPTGSGKTLAAFLWSIDRLASAPRPADALRRCRVVYVSPLKALAVDVQRNLREPLVGVARAAQRLGTPAPDIAVAVRSGDTPADERRRFARAPSDILITTPESLFLMLTSAAREALRGVDTVIVDEIHAVAGTKRGAHLAVSLDRLDALLDAPAQRVGLSATVRPVEEVGRFLAGGRPVTIVAPPPDKQWDLDVVVPVPDMGAMGADGRVADRASDDPRLTSIWPHVEERIVDLIDQHRSTLVFANSRRVAERLTARLNEIADERSADGATHVQRNHEVPAQVMGQAGRAFGAPPVLARAHHGSVSHEQRKQIEDDLKAGRLPAVVATSSLELGIDMGAVDLVVQVEAPPSVASGLQRVGRAGHQVGAVSRGVIFPKFRGDLVEAAVIAERMRAGAIEELSVPSNPLDVLSQQIVAMVAMDDWRVDDLEALVRRSASFTGLTRGVLDSVLDMLAGRYPSEEFSELRPRLVWDRTAGTLTARRGAQRIAVTSGGTIPDRGLFAVFVAGDGPGRRVGELDEEMVYETRVGDVITLGTTSWRVDQITHDHVLVTPAPGLPGRLPFWHGDSPGRPFELGRARGAFVRELTGGDDPAARLRLAAAGLDEWACDNLLGYLGEQREATGALPTDRQLVIERFTDELGDWRVVIHSPFGARVHAPWALAIGARMTERFGVDVQAMHADDGIVLRLPDLGDGGLLQGGGSEDGLDEALLATILIDPDEIATAVTDAIGGSALFASRFRECAARALLLPKRRPERRQALWQQRQRSAQLLQVASNYPAFPIVLEAVRECLQDVFDLPALVELMREVRSRQVGVVQVTTPAPSPFASSLLIGYVAQFMYEGDSPLAERRAAALALDPDLLAQLLGTSEGLSLRELLDPDAIARTYDELQFLVGSRKAKDADDVTDLLRVLGPLTTAEIEDRALADPGTVADWLGSLTVARRVFETRIGGRDSWVGAEDAGRVHDALGVSLPPDLPESFRVGGDDPLGHLVLRFARTHVAFDAAGVADRFGLGRAVAADVLARLVAAGRLVTGEFRPDASSREFCDPEVLRTVRRRSLAALRAEVEPVPRDALVRFLPAWQGVGGALRGVEGVMRVVEQLAGAVLPASAVESLVLPARVADYAPAMLDELCAAGEVVWRGHGAIAARDGWVSLQPADLVGPPVPTAQPDDEIETALLDAMSPGGAYFFDALAAAVPDASQRAVSEALWELVWKGLVTNDTPAPLRARLGGGTTTHHSRTTAPRGRYGRLRMATRLRSAPLDAGGRWSRVPALARPATTRMVELADVLLDRHGVVTRGAVQSEGVEGGFAGLYRVLRAAEDAGRVRRGYFVEGLGAAQFATVGAIDRLRGSSAQSPVALSACDPANPFGAALPWPAPADEQGHRPGRKAGALVVLADGRLVLYLERGGRTALTWTSDPEALAGAAGALAGLVTSGRVAALTIERVDGSDALGSRHPLIGALTVAGFAMTPRGYRLRR